MEDQRSLFQPLISTAAYPENDVVHHGREPKVHNNITINSSSNGIVSRLLFLLSIGILSIWANYESSKGFEITIVNAAPHSLAGQRFALFYVSNDRATRIVLNATNFVENLLYDAVDQQPNTKPVSHVTLRLAGENFTGEVSVRSSGDGEESHHFIIDISPRVVMLRSKKADVDHAMESAVLRGMARVWLWDGESRAPPELLSGVVEYVAMAAGFGRESSLGPGGAAELSDKCGDGGGGRVWYEDKDPRVVARFLDYYEKREKGFIRRLNGAMKDRWHERTVDDALGKPAVQYLCG
ncbi:Basic secretory protein [Trema orientale]|uniref:Basic secretory protein n=1 Tax=Trema orientale TaxID=63057 RepID=A0A2P5EYU3_TREOI|nr:Basic secretory protein [Trema orientale]